jgi:hypothetical protein
MIRCPRGGPRTAAGPGAAPGGELPQVQGVCLSGQAAVAREESCEREPLGVSEHRLDGDEDSGRGRGGHGAPPKVGAETRKLGQLRDPSNSPIPAQYGLEHRRPVTCRNRRLSMSATHADDPDRRFRAHEDPPVVTYSASTGHPVRRACWRIRVGVTGHRQDEKGTACGTVSGRRPVARLRGNRRSLGGSSLGRPRG